MANVQNYVYHKHKNDQDFDYLELTSNPNFKIYRYLLASEDIESSEYQQFFKFFASKYDMTKAIFQKTLNRISDNVPDLSILKDGDEIVCCQRGGRSARSLIFNHIDRSITRRDNSFIVSIRSKAGEYLACKSFKMKNYNIDFIREFRNNMEKFIENASENVIKENVKQEFERVLKEMCSPESKKS